MRKRVLLAVVIAAAVLIVLAAWFYAVVGGLMQREYKPDLIISSPDGQHELVVCEWSYLMGGGSEIYIRKAGYDKWYNSWMKTEIGTTTSNDGCCPFAKGYYYVEWESEKVTIHYYRGVDAEDGDDPATWLGLVSHDLTKD